jgi:hypothetical protein
MTEEQHKKMLENKRRYYVEVQREKAQKLYHTDEEYRPEGKRRKSSISITGKKRNLTALKRLSPKWRLFWTSLKQCFTMFSFIFLSHVKLQGM